VHILHLYVMWRSFEKRFDRFRARGDIFRHREYARHQFGTYFNSSDVIQPTSIASITTQHDMSVTVTDSRVHGPLRPSRCSPPEPHRRTPTLNRTHACAKRTAAYCGSGAASAPVGSLMVSKGSSLRSNLHEEGDRGRVSSLRGRQARGGQSAGRARKSGTRTDRLPGAGRGGVHCQ